jgi:hypothetical protein
VKSSIFQFLIFNLSIFNLSIFKSSICKQGMIVNTYPAGWEIIHQRAHGLLAVQLAYHWRTDQRPQRWVETLVAITEHDDAQEDWQGANHLNEAGAPVDFTHKPFSMTQLERIAGLSQHKGRWVALLISMHLSFIYEPLRGEHKELGPFLDLQKKNQQRWRKDLGIRVTEAEAAYAIVQWCDQFSLILCKHQLPAGERALEISRGPDGQRYDVVQRSDGTLKVNPWPFAEDAFTVAVEATYVEQLHYASDNELQSVMETSAIRPLEWHFVK